MKKLLFAACVFLACMGGATAARLVDFDFTGNAGNETTVAPSTTDPSISMATNLHRSNLNGGTTASWEADGYGVRPISTAVTDLETAVNNNRYVGFSITVNSGYSVSLSSLDFGWSRQNAKDRNFAVMASLDDGATGFTTNDVIDTESVSDSNTAGSSNTLDLSSDVRLQDIPADTTVEIRMYFYGDLNQWEGNALTSKNSLPGLDLVGTAEIQLGDQPVCTITSPSDNTLYAYGSYPATLPITVTVTDNVSVAEVRFYESGNLIGTETSDPFTFNWNWSPVQGTNYYLSARAEDGEGYIGTSQTVRVETDLDQPPSVTITNPADGDYYSYGSYPTSTVIQATATDDSGVTNVRFYANGSLIGMDATPPYALTWAGPVSANIYALTAVVEDDGGAAVGSAPVVIEALPSLDNELLAYDDFARAAKGLLHLARSGVGWAAAWNVQGASQAIPGYNLTNESPMVYGRLLTSDNYAVGGTAYLGCKRRLDVSGGGPFDAYLRNGDIGAVGTDVWAAYLYRRDGAASVSCILGFSRETDGNSPRGVNACRTRNSGGEWVIQHLTNGVLSQTVSSGKTCVADEPALIALHFEFGVGGNVSNHVVSMYVNPLEGTLGVAEPAAPDAVLNVVGDEQFGFDGIDFYPDAWPGGGSLDAFRIGTTYRAVTPIEPYKGTTIFIR